MLYTPKSCFKTLRPLQRQNLQLNVQMLQYMDVDMPLPVTPPTPSSTPTSPPHPTMALSLWMLISFRLKGRAMATSPKESNRSSSQKLARPLSATSAARWAICRRNASNIRSKGSLHVLQWWIRGTKRALSQMGLLVSRKTEGGADSFECSCEIWTA